MAVFPDLVRDLTERTKKYDTTEADALKWFAKALQYNVPGGKKNRGLVTVLAFKTLAKQDDLTVENIALAHYLGWCVEMVRKMKLIFFFYSRERNNLALFSVCFSKIASINVPDL